jgi:hypothetical protein
MEETVSWTARITQFATAANSNDYGFLTTAVENLAMDPATARHLAALLVVAAGEFESITSSDVQPKKALTPLNARRAKNSHERLASVTTQPKISQKRSGYGMAENKAKRLGSGVR